MWMSEGRLPELRVCGFLTTVVHFGPQRGGEVTTRASLGSTYNQIVNAWCLYDWANSAFATTVMAAILSPFFASMAAANLPDNIATAYWGYTSAAALLIAALAAPILRAIADHAGAKKRFLAFFTDMGVLFTLLLVRVGEGDWLLTLGSRLSSVCATGRASRYAPAFSASRALCCSPRSTRRRRFVSHGPKTLPLV